MKSEESGESRKRKLELRESENSASSSLHNQLKSPRLLPATTTHDQPAEDSPGNSSNTCESSRASDRIFAPCCSSNLTSKSVVDLEEDGDEVLSGAASAGRHSLEFSHYWQTNNAIVKKMPSDAELEEFFAAAETDLQKKFIDKYNYDIVKDEPLQGRYEWVQISESTEAKAMN